MPRKKGSTNKLTKDVKERLVNLIDDCVNSIQVEELTTMEKMKFLQLSLHYVVPKLRSSIVKTEADQQSWLKDAQIEIISRDKETDDWKSEFVPIPTRGEA